ncbi:hypothetical protein D3C78_1454190 [compost metagenome]
MPGATGSATQALAPMGMACHTGLKSKAAGCSTSSRARKLCQPCAPISKRSPAKAGMKRW